MRCYLCGGSLNAALQPSVPSTDGGRVHIACADRAALMAHRSQVARAMISAMVLSTLFMVIIFAGGVGLLLGVLVGLLLAAHVWINLRWWHRLIARIRLCYRLRRRA